MKVHPSLHRQLLIQKWEHIQHTFLIGEFKFLSFLKVLGVSGGFQIMILKEKK